MEETKDIPDKSLYTESMYREMPLVVKIFVRIFLIIDSIIFTVLAVSIVIGEFVLGLMLQVDGDVGVEVIVIILIMIGALMAVGLVMFLLFGSRRYLLRILKPKDPPDEDVFATDMLERIEKLKKAKVKYSKTTEFRHSVTSEGIVYKVEETFELPFKDAKNAVEAISFLWGKVKTIYNVYVIVDGVNRFLRARIEPNDKDFVIPTKAERVTVIHAKNHPTSCVLSSRVS
jgi:hypothetical protein